MMPDETDPPAPAALPAQDDPTTPEISARVAGQPSAPIRSPFVEGQRWREYQIGDPIETDTGWCYHAVNVGMLEDVEIRVIPINEQTEMRDQAWRELQSLDMRGLLKGIDALEEGEYRYEISRVRPKTTLREWASCRQASLDDVHLLVQQISDVLIAMHDRGIVHLNLRPDTIFILSEEAGLHVAVGGLEQATTYNQPGLIPIAVDPFYAPPEAAGLAKHSPGAGLRAWDWWLLGRIMQGLVLGRHVLSIVVNRDVTKATPELRARAEALLLERDPRAPRAGVVELMPPMSQRLTDLFRGLLTSSRSGRWGTDEVLRWLKQQPVKDRYQLGRNEELFAWKDRVFTIEEAAEFFSREENWFDGIANLFDKDDAMTLVSFVGDRPEYSKIRTRIDELHKFMEIPNWKSLPAEASQAALASAAWLLLGGEDAKLTLYGHRVDASCIKGLFARGGVAEGVAMVKALTVLPFIQMIEKADPDAARLLLTLAGTISGEAVTKAVTDGWLSLNSAADYARLLLLAMEPEQKLLSLCAGLKERFACSREEHIQQLFAQPNLSQPELVLLASTAAQPERYAYVAHAEWNRERYETLKARGARLAAGLFWLRLEQSLRFGYPLFGPWKIVLGIWFGVAVVAGWASGFGRLPLWISGAVAGAAALRFAGGWWLTILIRRKTSQTRPWTFFSPLSRCLEEAGAVLGIDAPAPTASSLGGELAAVQTEVDKLVLKPRPAPLPQPGLVLPAWIGPLAGWAFVLLLLLAGHWKPQRDSASAIDPTAAAALAIEKALTAGPPDAKLTPEDYFYGDPSKPPARWNVAKPSKAPVVPLARVKPASSDEVAAALIDGQRLLLPYQQNSIDALIAVPVSGANGSGLILYDGRNRRVIGRQVLLPSQLPSAKSWFEVEKLKVYYAGEPPPPPPPAPKPVVDPQKPVDTSDLPEREVRRGAYQDQSHGAEQKATNAQPLSDALDTMSP